MERGVCCYLRPQMAFSLGVPTVWASMHPSGSWHLGTSAPSQGSGQCSPFRHYASGPQPIPLLEILASSPQSNSRRPRHLGSDPCPPSPRTAPPRGRGSGLLQQWPLQLLRCPWSQRSCITRRAPSEKRGGKGARASCLAQPHFQPLLPRRAGGGDSTHAQSRPAEAACWED